MGPYLSVASLFGGSNLRFYGLGLLVVFVTYRFLHISVVTIEDESVNTVFSVSLESLMEATAVV